MFHKVMLIVLAAAFLAVPGGAQTVQVDALLGNDGTGVPAYLTIQAAVNAVLTNPTTPDVIELRTNAPHVQTATIQITGTGMNLTLKGQGGRLARVITSNWREPAANIDAGAIILRATSSTVVFQDLIVLPPPVSVVGVAGAVGADTNGMNGVSVHQGSNNSTVTLRNVLITGNDNANQPTSLNGSAAWSGNPNVTVWPGACYRANANVGMTYNVENCVFSQTADQALNVNQNIGATTATVGPAVVISGTGMFSYADDNCVDLNANTVTIQAANPKGIQVFNSSLTGTASAIVIQKAGTVLVERVWIHDFGNGNSNRGIYLTGVGGLHTTIRNCVFERVTGTTIRTLFTLTAGQMAGATCLIEDCTLDTNGQQGYYDGTTPLATVGQNPESIIFRRCTARNNAANGIRPRDYRNVLVQDCYFFHNGFPNSVGTNSDYQQLFADGNNCFADMETLTRTDTESLFERCTFQDAGNYGCVSFARTATMRNCTSLANGGPGFSAGARNARADIVLVEDCTSAYDSDNPVFTAGSVNRLNTLVFRGNDITLRRIYVLGSPLNGIFTLSDYGRDNEINRLQSVTVVNCASTAFRLENATTELSGCVIFNCSGAGLRKQVSSADVSTPGQANGLTTVDNCLFQQCKDGGVTTDYIINGPVAITNTIFRSNGAYGADLSSAVCRVSDCSFINSATGGVRVGFGPGPNATLDYIRRSSFLNNTQAGIYIGEAAGAAVGTVSNCTILGSNDGIHVQGIGITAPISISDCIIGGAGKTGIYADAFLFTPGINVSYSALIQQGVHALATVENDTGNFVTLAPAVIGSDPLFLSLDSNNALNFFAVDSSFFGNKGSGSVPIPLRGSGRYVGGTVEITSWRQF